MDAAQAILKKTPPSDLGKNLDRLVNHALKDDATARDVLETKHPLPFSVLEELEDKPFLICKYNRVGDKHRSPWTSKLYPHAAAAGEGSSHVDDVQGDEEMHLLEAKFNQVWESYKNLYYGHDSVGSVYLQDRGDTTRTSKDGAFQGMFGIHKQSAMGSWDSIHIVYVDEPTEKTCTYRVESSVLMVLDPSCESSSSQSATTKLDLSAYISKETTKSCKVSQAMLTASHIENIGTLIEANEIDLRSSIERVHIPKTQEIMNDIQKSEPKRPVAVNPLMGMIMGSDVLKKKLASEAAGS